MDLKTLTRDKITNTILRHTHSSHSWRILIINAPTAKILTTLFTKDELIFHDIYNYESLENTNRNCVPDHPAIYFVEGNKAAVKQIDHDIKNKMYSRYTVFLTEEPEYKPKFEYKVANINFICLSKNVFTCRFENLMNVSNVLGHSFSVNYFGGEKEAAEKVEMSMNGVRKGEMLIFNRFDDLITPFVRFYTFESLLRNLKICNEFDEKSDLWKNIRYEHVRDVNIILSREAKKLNKEIEKIKDVDAKDLIKMVYEAPEKVNLKKEVCDYLDYLDKAITIFEKEHLNFVSLTEQNIILKFDQDGNRYSEGVKDFMKICKNEEVNLCDKKNLYYILCIVGYDFQEKEEKILSDLGIIEKDDIFIKKKLVSLRMRNVIMRDSEFKYTISRFKPLLYFILKDFMTKNKLTKCITKVKSVEPESLRKSEFIYADKVKNKKILCVYVINGLTHEEIKVAHEIGKIFRVNIIIGSDCILDQNLFIEKIKNLK